MVTETAMITAPAREVEGLILHLQRLSTEDGPGIRTTVFMKQCPLHCWWCHNPESISRKPELQWFESRCLGCQTCVNSCPRGCLVMTPAGLQIDRERCEGCGTCASKCPANAVELLGRRIGIEALVAELLKDRVYYEQSGGGVTFSGGEPLMQPGFTAAVFSRLQAAGIHTALDTCGLASDEALNRVLPYADLVLFDIKLIDPEKHRLYTGQSNEIILRNLLTIRDRMLAGELPRHLWIRTPLIPDATATYDNLTGIGQFIAEHLADVVERWELCAFNNLCRDQYKRLGIEWHYAGTPLMSRAELAQMADYARSSGVNPALVFPTGAARIED